MSSLLTRVGTHGSTRAMSVTCPFSRTLTRLCDVTSGSSGCVLVFVSTPEDLCAHRVAEKLRLVATEQSHDLDQDGFYKFPVFFKA